ncbi:hypothetical protein O181_054615 [Austropuccinia psidii MF-1]|uniref:Uncharacterized protein n=1 Tax=Austropuccinia psidii MF-1 TaxID=1389203 RepID=A0A9Q3HUI7_9BASI|nr:hypothetical protein [Austropuccinia psidii MF-1]
MQRTIKRKRRNSMPLSKSQTRNAQTEDSYSYSMGNVIREQSDDDKDPREEFLVEYQEETKIEIQEIQFEAGMPQDTAKQNLLKHPQAAQKFLVTPTQGMEYILGTATKMTVCIENAQHPLIIESGAHCSIVARTYLDHHFSNWEKKSCQQSQRPSKINQGRGHPLGQLLKS